MHATSILEVANMEVLKWFYTLKELSLKKNNKKQ